MLPELDDMSHGCRPIIGVEYFVKRICQSLLCSHGVAEAIAGSGDDEILELSSFLTFTCLFCLCIWRICPSYLLVCFGWYLVADCIKERILVSLNLSLVKMTET